MSNEKLRQIATEMREHRVNHGKHTSPTLERWADRIEAALSEPVDRAPEHTCSMGVGCEKYGCYAAAHGVPERCGMPEPAPAQFCDDVAHDDWRRDGFPCPACSNPKPAPGADERADFEAWQSKETPGADLAHCGAVIGNGPARESYRNMYVAERWIGWQARATRPAQTEQQLVDHVPVTMKLPCEVKLPGGMTVGKGCQLTTLLLAMRDRESGPQWRQRFGQPQPFDPALLNLIGDVAAPIAQPVQTEMVEALRRIADSAAKHVEQNSRPDLVTVAHWVGVADTALGDQGGRDDHC